jgi:putative ABC transport system permease protein
MGKRANIGAGSGFPMDSAAREVVGVVGDVRRTALDKAPLPQIYIPEAQLAFPQLSLMVRTRPGATNVAGDLHRLVIGMDPDQAISPVRPLESVLSLSLARQKFSALLLGIFAAAALALSAVGIYGVMMSMVTQRRRELAVRMALGARPADVLRLVVKHGVTLAALGVAVGLAGALALSRFLSSLLYGVKAGDPVTLAVVSLVLAGVALLASYLPARRATRVDPAVVLGAGG